MSVPHNLASAIEDRSTHLVPFVAWLFPCRRQRLTSRVEMAEWHATWDALCDLGDDDLDELERERDWVN